MDIGMNKNAVQNERGPHVSKVLRPMTVNFTKQHSISPNNTMSWSTNNATSIQNQKVWQPHRPWEVASDTPVCQPQITYLPFMLPVPFAYVDRSYPQMYQSFY